LKTKFISVILSVAVILGLMLVPAALPTALAVTNEWAFQMQPNVTKVTPSSSFTVNISAVQLSTENSDGWEAYVRYDPLYLSVSGIDIPSKLPLPNNQTLNMYNVPGIYDLGNPGYNNTEGILYVGYSPNPGSPKLNQTFWFATIHFDVAAVVGTVTTYVNFTTNVTDLFHLTEILLGSTQVQKWSEFHNDMVMIGSPTLTVTVNPPGDGTVNIVPGSPYVWDQVVTLTAVNSTAGWGWASWSGTDNDAVNPTTVTMSTDKSVTANFVELPPGLSVNPLTLNFSAMAGGYTDNKTVTISNTGGGLLKWTKGCPPEWCVDDQWVWSNIYGTPTNIVTMNVTDTSGCDYTAFAVFTPPAPRVINVTSATPPYWTLMNATMVNATVLVDKYSLDTVKQEANLTVQFGVPWYPANVSATYNYFQVTGHHGWPYSWGYNATTHLGKIWGYAITQKLWVAGLPQPQKPTTIAYALVTNYTNEIPAAWGGGSLPPLPGYCWEITHFVDKNDPANTTPAVIGNPACAFKVEYWQDSVRNFVTTIDGGTYVYPPPDIQILASPPTLHCPPPIAQPTWLSEDKTSGVLGIGGSEIMTVTANTSGLAVGLYNGSFTISAPKGDGCILQETVNIPTFEVLPATALPSGVIRLLPADALDENAEYPGDTFWVWVNFTASVNNFTSIGLTDLAPAGWDVQTDVNWTIPNATWTLSPGNKAEYAWSGPQGGYPAGTTFKAKYLVTIPATATPGYSLWPNGDGTKAWAEYYFGAKGPYTTNVTGNSTKIVTVPGKVWGETRDVNAELLTTTLVMLYQNPAVYKDEDSSTDPNAMYSDDANTTGQYWMNATKYCYKFVATNAGPAAFSVDFGDTAKLAAGLRFDFEGDYGLVPKACTMSYAMKSVNHWLFTPIDGLGDSHPEWKLSVWKAGDSVASWQFPSGCNT